ncbi:MAG: glycosyltransferase family 2 protein, partial [Acidobacteriota bacterium]|nr:glycosyltransferase family 2 protein [Acidobacteriota bacterium]
PEVDYVGGRVLPEWSDEPPSWLTPAHWSPLALTDHGDAPFYVDKNKTVCLVGANLAFRREVFNQFGLFDPDCQRVRDGIGSTEDHELQLRLWRAGIRGLYVPAAIVTAAVQAERTTRKYHRRWHAGHGKFCAKMRLNEITDAHGRATGEWTNLATLFGVPGYIYRELLREGACWLSAVMRWESTSSEREHQVRYWFGYVGERWRQNAAERRHSVPAEFVTFTKLVLRKKAAARRSVTLTTAQLRDELNPLRRNASLASHTHNEIVRETSGHAV